jgi:hypothetical protein
MKLISLSSKGAVATKLGETLPEIEGGRVTVPELEGIKDLALFGGPAWVEGDLKRFLKLCIEAVAPYDQEIRMEAIARLRFHNPRNPLRPTHQDLREACGKVRREFDRVVVEYFSTNYGEGGPDRKWPANMGGPPFTPECRVSFDIAKRAVESMLARYVGMYGSRLAEQRITLARFDEIPESVFPPGEREEHRAVHVRREMRRQRWIKHSIYLESLPEIVREARRDLVGSHSEWRKYSGDIESCDAPPTEVERDILRCAKARALRRIACSRLQSGMSSFAWTQMSEGDKRALVEAEIKKLDETELGLANLPEPADIPWPAKDEEEWE